MLPNPLRKLISVGAAAWELVQQLAEERRMPAEALERLDEIESAHESMRVENAAFREACEAVLESVESKRRRIAAMKATVRDDDPPVPPTTGNGYSGLSREQILAEVRRKLRAGEIAD